MTPLRATALARKWCAYCKGDGERMNPNAHHYHGAIESALREVVERCVEIVGGDEGGEGVDTGRIWRNTMRHQIIAAIRGEFGEEG